MKSEACLNYLLKLCERVKMSSKEDIDLILKIQKELKIDDSDQILKRIIQLNNKNSIKL